jgi:hypothetical protein
MMDYLECWIYSHQRVDTTDKAERLLRVISSREEFTPERWSPGWEPLRDIFIKENLSGPTEALLNRFANEKNPENIGGELLMRRSKKKPSLWYKSEWKNYKYYPFGISYYTIDEAYVRKDNILKHWKNYIDDLFVAHGGWYGFIASSSEYKSKLCLEYKNLSGFFNQVGPAAQLQENIPGVFWGNYFNKFYIDWFGKEKFDTLPCVTKKELPDGSVFFTTAETPWDWETEKCRRLQRDIIEHLGKDKFFDMEDLRKKIEKFGKNGLSSIGQFIPEHRVPNFPFEFNKKKRMY